MNRRTLLLATGALVIAPVVRAQPAQKVVLIGVLAGKTDAMYRPAFASALGELGWTEGKNLAIEWRQSEAPADIAGHADALMRLRPNVLLTAGPRITQAMAKLTTAVPIVFLAVGDPVGLGLVRSLPYPGGNLTGFQTFAGEEFAGKLLQILKEAVPGITRVGALVTPGNDMHQNFAAVTKTSATRLHMGVSILSVRDADGFEAAFETGRRDGIQALLVPGDLLFSTNKERIAALALRHRLPSMFIFSYYADAGGLLAYGVSVDALYRGAARTADKIARGARPQDIPVERPTRFELVVNLKTAQALGLKIPQSVLLRADRVIE